MILRCTKCQMSVEVSRDTKTWQFPLWDHLLDEHLDLCAIGRQATVEFRGPHGLSTWVVDPV